MRILHVITSLATGGAEKLVTASVPLQQDKGIEVDVLVLQKVKAPFWDELEKTTKGKMVGLTTKSVYNPILIFKLIPYLRKYDIIHIHLFPTLYWVVLAKWVSISNVKLIYTEHSTDNRRRHIYFYKIFDRIIYMGINRIVTISDEVDYNTKKHLNSSKYNFVKIYNGVSVDLFRNATPHSKKDFFEEDDIILIQVSSFRWQKDQSTLIRSLQHLPQNVKLILVGDGELISDCKKLVENLNLGNRVKFLGIRTDVPQLLKMSDIIILSSIHEGLSLSNIEGMSVGKPFIGSNVPGLKEIVLGYGLLFEKGNEKELANLILHLIIDQGFYDYIANKCYSRAKEFNIDKMINQYIKLYQEINE